MFPLSLYLQLMGLRIMIFQIFALYQRCIWQRIKGVFRIKQMKKRSILIDMSMKVEKRLRLPLGIYKTIIIHSIRRIIFYDGILKHWSRLILWRNYGTKQMIPIQRYGGLPRWSSVHVFIYKRVEKTLFLDEKPIKELVLLVIMLS